MRSASKDGTGLDSIVRCKTEEHCVTAVEWSTDWRTENTRWAQNNMKQMVEEERQKAGW